MPRAREKDLLLVSKSDKSKLEALKAGASLVDRTGYTIAKLQEKAIKDRLSLARTLLQEAQLATTVAPPAFRTSISRAYYSMYHSVRAVCFFYHGGDDYEQHLKLPGAIPPDFPLRSRWENDLKHARFDRNRADYDPYPRSSSSFETTAVDLLRNAGALLTAARSYLRNKGCSV